MPCIRQPQCAELGHKASLAFCLCRWLTQDIDGLLASVADVQQLPAAAQQLVDSGDVIISAYRDLHDFCKRTNCCVANGDGDRLHRIGETFLGCRPRPWVKLGRQATFYINRHTPCKFSPLRATKRPIKHRLRMFQGKDNWCKMNCSTDKMRPEIWKVAPRQELSSDYSFRLCHCQVFLGTKPMQFL